MNFKIRSVKLKNGNTSIQVYIINNRKREILKHIGTTNTEAGIKDLKEQAVNWINLESNTYGLFKDNQDSFFNNYKYVGFRYNFAYEFLDKVFKDFNFDKHIKNIIKDLCIAQILEPSSKRQNLLFLERYFGIKYNLNNLYEYLSVFNSTVKENIESEVLKIAKKHFNFDFSFVLYDVTTLYFESFKNDEFKRPGFSKDHKHNQPQIVIGLIVNGNGFPVHYEVFKGNSFEGNTFLPIVLDFKRKYNIENITVVADSAMFSKLNFEKLKDFGINYIVGARLLNQKKDVLDRIEKEINKVDGGSIKIDELIVEYSAKRFSKDKHELEKQIEKAKIYENIQTTKIRRIKFLKNDKVKYFVDQEMIDKNTKLLGLKGYVTNLDLPNTEIINYYHNLFKVEHAFRIAKSDLEMRPIYHYKEESIKNHIMICFMCLSISVYLEIKNGKSIKYIVGLLKNVTDAKILNLNTNVTFFDRSILDKETTNLLH
jgi:transposase